MIPRSHFKITFPGILLYRAAEGYVELLGACTENVGFWFL